MAEEMGRPHQQKNNEFQISYIDHANFHSFLINLTGDCFKKEELNVQVEGVDKVIVSGENRESGRFWKEFSVPPDSNMDQISATYCPKLLTIKIPKKRAQETDEGSAPREIIQPAKAGEDQKEGSGRAESIQENLEQRESEGDDIVVDADIDQKEDDEEEFHDINCRTEAHEEKQEEREKSDSKERGVLLVGDQEMRSGEKRRWREENIKRRCEEWRNEDLEVISLKSSTSTAMERIRKNKAIIFTAAIAFSFGFCLSRKLGFSSSNDGSESPCCMDVTINIERYISNPCSSSTNDTKNSGFRR